MRIGELAALAGVSTRTVRHYHHLGLLPEPVRLPNGYREYRLRDAVLLARVRRLAELGLSLDEIRDVLGDDQGKDLREVLVELDADLARQQEEIGVRRARLAGLLAEPDLSGDAAASPELAAVLRDLSAGGSRFAEMDRQMLTLMGTVAGADERERVVELLRPLAEPGTAERGHVLYERLDELADADPGDPRVAELAADLAGHLPEEMVKGLLGNLPEEGAPWMAAMYEDLSPAQAEVFRLMVAVLKEKM
jgi:DNA-binding transcriptional MerR regulator